MSKLSPTFRSSNKEHRRFARSQRITIIGGILSMVVILVILQLWLLTSTMNDI